MKQWFVAIMFIAALQCSLYAQNNADEPEADTVNPANILIHRNSSFSVFSYQFPDGTPVSPKALPVLLDIPANAVVLQKAKQLTGFTRVLSALTFAAAVGVVVYASSDWPHSDVMVPVLGGVAAGAVVGSLYTSQAAGITYLQAVDNYNLTILDIPLRKH